MKSPRPPHRVLRADFDAPRTRPVRPAAPPLRKFSANLIEGLARKTRFVEPSLAANWGELAGPELSRLCRPGRLTGSAHGRTLEVVVSHGAAAASVEFAAETLRRRLNSYFGPNSIARIIVIQGRGPGPARPGGGGGAGGGLGRFRRG
ncbi:MAG: DciA family protein [Parvularculaceae bacterium]